MESQKFKTDTHFPLCKKEKQKTKASARTGDEEIRTSVWLNSSRTRQIQRARSQWDSSQIAERSSWFYPNEKNNVSFINIFLTERDILSFCFNCLKYFSLGREQERDTTHWNNEENCTNVKWATMLIMCNMGSQRGTKLGKRNIAQHCFSQYTHFPSLISPQLTTRDLLIYKLVILLHYQCCLY